MRPACAVLLVATTVHAEPTREPPPSPPKATVGVSGYVGNAVGLLFSTSIHLEGSVYLDGQVSVGGIVSDARDVDMWSAQFGASTVRWTERVAVGARASAGYQRFEVTRFEALFDDEPWTEYQNMVYCEGALFIRGRIAPRFGFELLGAVRGGLLTEGEGGSAVTGYIALGFHVTI